MNNDINSLTWEIVVIQTNIKPLLVIMVDIISYNGTNEWEQGCLSIWWFPQWILVNVLSMSITQVSNSALKRRLRPQNETGHWALWSSRVTQQHQLWKASLWRNSISFGMHGCDVRECWRPYSEDIKPATLLLYYLLIHWLLLCSSVVYSSANNTANFAVTAENCEQVYNLQQSTSARYFSSALETHPYLLL